MTKAQLKKHLQKLPKEQVIEVILELYDARKEAKEYLDFYTNPNEDAKLEEYKQIIFNEFYPKRGEPKCRFSVCKKAISDFTKLKPSPSCIADLMLFYIETGVNSVTCGNNIILRWKTILPRQWIISTKLVIWKTFVHA